MHINWWIQKFFFLLLSMRILSNFFVVVVARTWRSSRGLPHKDGTIAGTKEPETGVVLFAYTAFFRRHNYAFSERRRQNRRRWGGGND